MKVGYDIVSWCSNRWCCREFWFLWIFFVLGVQGLFKEMFNVGEDLLIVSQFIWIFLYGTSLFFVYNLLSCLHVLSARNVISLIPHFLFLCIGVRRKLGTCVPDNDLISKFRNVSCWSKKWPLYHGYKNTFDFKMRSFRKQWNFHNFYHSDLWIGEISRVCKYYNGVIKYQLSLNKPLIIYYSFMQHLIFQVLDELSCISISLCNMNLNIYRNNSTYNIWNVF